VPEVQIRAAGTREALARPRAKKPAARSSSSIQVRSAGQRSAAIARGVEREPGEITTWATPAAARLAKKQSA
jgi:hypothetical protein